jgi:hypothetical protein
VACVPQLSNGGLVDYGTLLAKDLSASNETPLPTRTLQLSVSCDAATPFALKMHDNRNGSATGGTDETAYGLDLDNSHNKIGRFTSTSTRQNSAPTPRHAVSHRLHQWRGRLEQFQLAADPHRSQQPHGLHQPHRQHPGPRAAAEPHRHAAYQSLPGADADPGLAQRGAHQRLRHAEIIYL